MVTVTCTTETTTRSVLPAFSVSLTLTRGQLVVLTDLPVIQLIADKLTSWIYLNSRLRQRRLDRSSKDKQKLTQEVKQESKHSCCMVEMFPKV